MTVEEDMALCCPQYWDSRYVKSGGVDSTYLLVASLFSLILSPFFFPQRHLFKTQDVKAKEVSLILHLGSGNSDISHYPGT